MATNNLLPKVTPEQIHTIIARYWNARYPSNEVMQDASAADKVAFQNWRDDWINALHRRANEIERQK